MACLSPTQTVTLFLSSDPFLWFEISSKHGGSLFKALSTSFPAHNWEPWRFVDERVPGGYWMQLGARRKYFDWLQTRLGYESLDDWYKLTKALVKKNHGGGMLLHYYKDNVRDFVMEVCPEHNWKVWKFKRAPSTWTRNSARHREWFDLAAKKLGFTTLDAWYSLSTPELVALVGEDPVTVHHGHSLQKALRRCYPEHDWQQWRFRNSKRASVEVQRRLLENAATQVWGWKDPANSLQRWYEVKFQDLVSAGVSGLITGRYGSSLAQALLAIYPEHKWDEFRFEKLPNRHNMRLSAEDPAPT